MELLQAGVDCSVIALWLGQRCDGHVARCSPEDVVPVHAPR